MRKLVLFDIDGTLVLTGGAGLRAMNRALEEVLGHPDGLDGIQLAGRTDWAILADAVGKVGRALDDPLLAALRDGYVRNLAAEIDRPGRGVKAVMPGIRDLLDALAARDDVFVALLTGNFEAGARIKLEHFDLWRYFSCGAFGGDAADRNALVPFAVARARACGLPDIAPSHVIVVGDTPHDVACAKAAGAVPVAVATGGYSVDQLRESGADIVFNDLGDTAAFLDLVEPARPSGTGDTMAPRK
ncbi:MAG: haloacid dehalogenase-like hydrolase [Acidobacteria bacterium]|nr:haloacid dehalogenase-like hydrolase [Acidobacteriota bacterium]